MVKPGGTVIEYVHNANNQRVAKKVNGTVTEKYLWANLTTLLAVYDGNDSLITRFEYADNRMPYKMTYNGQAYYLGYNQVGSLRTVTAEDGTIVKTVEYDSFGNVLLDSNQSLKVPFGFAGGLYDPDTKLTRFGYRDYDAQTGKWTAKDPIGFDGGDSNLYGYVLGDPVNLVDPLGLYGTNSCEYYKIRCWLTGIHYYCETAQTWCNRFPNYPNPDPSTDNDYEGWARCTRKCLQDCDKENATYCTESQIDDFWDEIHWNCHYKCYTDCALAEITHQNPY